ncbi:hypothetical protein FJZ31_16100 [Candidatus Poribacteria bacterium]|nr:hypothetical protein [Candidatus Poribacteria bacterium]
MESRVKVVDKDFIVRKSEEIYQNIKTEMEANHKGKFLAIDPESGNYYLGKTSLEAGLNGRKEHPNSVFYIIRIGFPYVYKRRW